MTDLCRKCFYYVETKDNDTIVCDRIWECYVKPKTECKYFKDGDVE